MPVRAGSFRLAGLPGWRWPHRLGLSSERVFDASLPGNVYDSRIQSPSFQRAARWTELATTATENHYNSNGVAIVSWGAVATERVSHCLGR
jgi:hypothetical protein